MRFAFLPAFVLALSACATAVPSSHLQVLALRQLDVPGQPGTNTTSGDVDQECFRDCAFDATQLHHYKQDDCSKGSQLQQQTCACKSPYIPDTKKCMTKCISPASAAQEAVDALETGCAKVLATGAAPALVVPLGPAMALAFALVAAASLW